MTTQITVDKIIAIEWKLNQKSTSKLEIVELEKEQAELVASLEAMKNQPMSEYKESALNLSALEKSQLILKVLKKMKNDEESN